MNLNPNVTYYSEISPIGKPMLDMLGITYADSCIETLQLLSYEGDASFTLLTGIKYLWRLGQKTEDVSGDLIKAIDYFTWSLEDSLHPLPKRWVNPVYFIVEECQTLLANGRKKGEISIVKLNEVAQMPVYAHEGDSGADLKSTIAITIPAGDRAMVSTGIAVNMPSGIEAQVRSRSGLAAKFGIAVLNSPGTIDSSYTGEISVILVNHSKVDFVVGVGDKIAQLVFCHVLNNAELTVVDKTTKETSRGAGGFGSTGIFASERTEETFDR
jgi:dUTP pyrophosphatase